MASKNNTFKFDQNADFQSNMAAFSAYMATINNGLGAALSAHLAGLRDETVKQGDLWTALFNNLEAAAKATATPVTPQTITATASIAASAPVAAHPAVTGWLLRGISIEGFRGINNEDKPLELNFHPNKINSVSAVNGVGKSSIYDAIRYAIFGRLQWLEDLPASERDSDYYLNKFNKSKTSLIKLKLEAKKLAKPAKSWLLETLSETAL